MTNQVEKYKAEELRKANKVYRKDTTKLVADYRAAIASSEDMKEDIIHYLDGIKQTIVEIMMSWKLITAYEDKVRMVIEEEIALVIDDDRVGLRLSYFGLFNTDRHSTAFKSIPLRLVIAMMQTLKELYKVNIFFDLATYSIMYVDLI